MKLNTTTLFYLLIKTLQPQSIYDIGSLDGQDALRFRQISPNSRIIALEANPAQVLAMKRDKALKEEKIEIYYYAVSNKGGTTSFYTQNARTRKGWRRGISSLHKRIDAKHMIKINVPSTRLDRFIQKLDGKTASIALWIDVEGAAFEVLESIKAVCDRVQIIHTEVETRRFWYKQKLKPNVKNLLQKMGFCEIARGFNEQQHDLIFLNKKYLSRSSIKIRLIVLLAWILTYLGFLITIIPKVRPLVSKIDIIRRI